MEFFKTSILVTTIMSWLVAQILKVILVFIKNKKLDFRRLVGSGGMPSSHAAFVVSLAVAVGLAEGFSGTAFAICVVVALVVMYDAAGVRRAAGQQAKILNILIDEWENKHFENTEKKLKELLGHTPTEVLAGGALGALIAFLRHF